MARGLQYSSPVITLRVQYRQQIQYTLPGLHEMEDHHDDTLSKLRLRPLALSIERYNLSYLSI